MRELPGLAAGIKDNRRPKVKWMLPTPGTPVTLCANPLSVIVPVAPAYLPDPPVIVRVTFIVCSLGLVGKETRGSRLRPIAQKACNGCCESPKCAAGEMDCSISGSPPKLAAHCRAANSVLACLRIGISGSASFQSVRKSSYAAFALAVSRATT